MAETAQDLQFAKQFVDLANTTLDAAAKFKKNENQVACREFARYLMRRAMSQTEYKPAK